MLRKLALLIVALSAVALGANTQIIDIIPSPKGAYVSGSLNIAWPAFVSGGVSVPAGSMQYQIINGLVNLSLPAYNGYQVTYTLPPAASYTVYWSVPVSATPLTIAQVQVNYVPVPSLSILPSQLTQAGATDGQALVWSQAAAMWLPGTVSGGGSGTGACPSGQVATAVNAGSAPTCNIPAYSWLSGIPSLFAPTAHNLLSSSHGDTTAASVTRGGLITGQGSSPSWSLLSLGSTGAYLRSNGSDLGYSAVAAGGAGACSTGQVVTGTNDNAAPSCSAPAYSWLTGSPTLNYQTVQANTTSQTQRLNLNFSSQFALTDSAGSNRTTVDLASTISASTTGNAATATALAATPSGCSTGQYVTAIAANGTPTCSTPAGGGGTVTTTGSPAASQLSAFSGPASVTSATPHNVAALLACADTTGSGTAQSCTTSPTFTPVAGDWINYTSTTASGATLTIAVNGASAATVMKGMGAFGVTSGDIPANKPMALYYDGTNWQALTVHNECNITSPTTNTIVYWTAVGCATNSLITFSGANVVAFGEPISLGPDTTSNYIQVTGTSNSSGVTVDLGVAADTTNPTRYATAALGQAFDAISTSTAGGVTTINIVTVPGVTLTGIEDGNVTAGDLVGPSSSVKGELTDLGTTDQRQVPYNQSIVGRALATNVGAGFAFKFKYWGTGIYGTMINGNADLVAPTITSGFGTSPSISGKNTHLTVTIGTGTVTTGVVTFGSAFTNIPQCSANDKTTATWIQANATSVTSLTLNGTFTAADKIDVLCNGN